MLRHSTCGLILLLIGTCSTLHGQVSGIVRDAGLNTPIEGALVSLQATGVRVLTASDGTYLLPGLTGEVVIVAAVPGAYNASVTVTAPATAVDLAVEMVPVEDDPTYTWFTPENCGNCHPDQYQQWNNSPMQKAGLNTWVYDIYDGSGTPGGLGGFVYQRDSIFAASNPHSECAACHQPEPWVEQGPLGLQPLDAVTPGMAHGVSCEVCHKIAAVDASKINFPGIVPESTTFIRPSGGAQVEFGVLADSDFLFPGVMRAAFNPQLVAEACGTCHQDKNDPDEDGDFEEPNGIISEPTYLEWAASPYGDVHSPLYQSCVDCHMPPTGADQISNFLFPPLLRDPATIRSHEVRGTTPEFLENAVTLTVETQVVGNELIATVAIENDLTGHHVPTGVTIRNMILLVEATRVEDGAELLFTGTETVHALGGVGIPSQGNYAGLPGKLFGKVNIAANGQSPTFFTDAVSIVFDSRIPALATDTTTYPFLLPSGGGTLEVTARLIYRRSWRALTVAKGWTEDGHGNPLADVLAPHYGHLMEEELSTETLPYTAPTIRRGDVNADGMVDLADAVTLLEYQFIGGSDPSCLEAADGNGDSILDLADPIRILMYLFGREPLAAPGAEACGAVAAPTFSCAYSACP